MNSTLRIAFIAVVLASLAGCGNKGPLMLPAKPAPIDPATVPSADAQAEQAAEDPAPTTGEEPVQSQPTPPVEPPPADGTPEIPPETPASDDGDGRR